jgi:hypothetical protein
MTTRATHPVCSKMVPRSIKTTVVNKKMTLALSEATIFTDL